MSIAYWVPSPHPRVNPESISGALLSAQDGTQPLGPHQPGLLRWMMSDWRTQEGGLSRHSVTILKFCGNVLIQGVGLWASCLLLLEHRHTHSFADCLGCCHPRIAELNSCNRDYMTHNLLPVLIFFWNLNFKNLPSCLLNTLFSFSCFWTGREYL